MADRTRFLILPRLLASLAVFAFFVGFGHYEARTTHYEFPFMETLTYFNVWMVGIGTGIFASYRLEQWLPSSKI